MLTVLTDAEIAGALYWEPLVSSWLGGQWLADVPVTDGSVTWSTRREVPGSLDLTVPRMDGRDWCPGLDPAHPLAQFGQTLRASIRVTTVVSRRVVVVPVGVFRIESWEDQGDTVAVAAVSMMQLVENARLRHPTAPRPLGTLGTELRRMVPAQMGLSVSTALTDRGCPSMTWGESRMDAIREIVDAWPARLRETMDGSVTVLPPLADAVTSPALRLHHGEGGTLVDAYPSGSSDGIYNVVVVRGTENDDAGAPLIQSEAVQAAGPLSVTGPFGEKPRFFASPLITSWQAAWKAAATILADSQRQVLTIPVTAAADPRIELDDAAEVVDRDGRMWLGFVAGYTLPLRPADMRIDIEVTG